VLLPRSVEAHATLPALLCEAGADVRTVDVYRNALPEAAADLLRRELEPGIDAVLFTSPSTVERLSELLGPEGLRTLGKSAVLACIGETTAAALEAVGLAPTVLAELQSDLGLVEALERYYGVGDHAVS
jgi:uroporphyrinogen-III synthase